MAQSAIDLFNGAKIDATTGLGHGSGTTPDGMFGTFGNGPETGNSIFGDETTTPLFGTAPVHTVDFTPVGGPATLSTLTAYLTADGDSVSRKADDFTLIADTNGVAGFQGTDFHVSSGTLVYAGRYAVLTLPFNVTASAFRLEVTPSNSGPFTGVRVTELDAFGAAPLYFTGSQSNSLSTIVGGLTNFSIDAAGTTNAAALPTAATDISFAASANTTAANFDAVLGDNLAVNSVTFGGGANATTPVTVGGANTLTIAAARGYYAAGTGIVMNATSAANTIAANIAIAASQKWINDSAAALTVSGGIALGSHTLTLLGSGPQQISGTIAGSGGIIAAGDVRLSGANTYAGTTVVSAGTLVATPPATANLLASAGGVDILGGKLVLDYTAAATPVAEVKVLLTAAAASNFTTGQLRATGLPAGQTIGYADDGISAVTLRITLVGDADLDGDVDFNDFLSLQSHYGDSGTRFDQGNFNYDALTDFNDFLALQSNYGQSLNGDAVADSDEQIAALTAFGLTNAVPEPAAFGVFGFGAMFVRRRRR